MAPLTTPKRQNVADQYREAVLTTIMSALVRHRISGRELSRRVAAVLGISDGSHGWWSKRYNGELALTVADLGAISDATNITVPELLGFQPPDMEVAAEHLNEFLRDRQVPRSIKDEVLTSLGSNLRVAYQVADHLRAIATKKAPAQRRAR